MNAISILVVSNLTLLRETWSMVLKDDPHFNVLGHSACGEAAVRFCRQHFPDVVLMNINFPCISQLADCEAIIKNHPGTHILVISEFNHSSNLKTIMKNGISGYITKNSSKKELFEAVVEVSQGRKFICQEIKNFLAAQLMEETPPIEPMTHREKEIIQLIRHGNSSKEIAGLLSVSYKTVEVHRCHILRKLKLKNAAALINYAHHHMHAINS